MQPTILAQLAHEPPGDIPVLSVYLDVRPLGSRPEEYADQVRLRTWSHAIAESLWPRGAGYEAFHQDIAQVERYLEEELPGNIEGLALFASAQRDLFIPVVAGAPFTFEAAFASTFQIYQLVRLLDQYETAAIVVAARAHVRLFVARWGFLDEVKDIVSDARLMRQIHFFAGAGIKHYEQHFAEHRRRFAQEIATEVERLVHAEGATRLLLAGNQEALPWLRAELPDALLRITRDVPLPLAIDEVGADIRRIVLPILMAAEAEEQRAIGDRVVDATRAHGLGMMGRPATQAALQMGQVDTLVLTDDAGIDQTTRNEFTRLALAEQARVEIIPHHETLSHLDGIGALLRYRLPVEAST